MLEQYPRLQSAPIDFTTVGDGDSRLFLFVVRHTTGLFKIVAPDWESALTEAGFEGEDSLNEYSEPYGDTP